eukprot:5080058-Amphidinium_carterae.1
MHHAHPCCLNQSPWPHTGCAHEMAAQGQAIGLQRIAVTSTCIGHTSQSTRECDATVSINSRAKWLALSRSSSSSASSTTSSYHHHIVIIFLLP